LAGSIIVKILASRAGIIAIIDGISDCGGKRGRAGSQARTVPI